MRGDRAVAEAAVTASAHALCYVPAELRDRALVLAACRRHPAALKYAGALRAFSPDTEVRVYPRYDTQPFDRFSPHSDIETRRMSLLYALLSAEAGKPLTIVAPWSALMRRVLPRAEFRSRITH